MLDTNVWISALLWTGPPKAILRAGEADRIILVTSPSIVGETREVLARPKFAQRIAMLSPSDVPTSSVPDEMVETWYEDNH